MPKSKDGYTTSDLASTFQVSRYLVQRLLTENSVPYEMEIVQGQAGGRVRRYKPVSYRVIQQYLGQDRRKKDQYISIRQAALALGREDVWVQNRVNELGCEVLHFKMQGRMARYISRKDFRLIKRLNVPVAPPEWVTYSEIMRRLGKSEDWVKNRIKKYKPQSMLCRDSRGHHRVFYSPTFWDELESEATLYPACGDWLTVSEVAREARIDRCVAQYHLKNLKIPTEKRLDKSGWVRDHYPPKAVEILLEKLFPAVVRDAQRPAAYRHEHAVAYAGL